MKALDTFRIPPYRHNCAQAIANRWRMLYARPDIVESYAPYVGGHAPGGLCGALFAAMEAMPEQADEIMAEFVRRVGAAHCREIKTQTATPCEQCVSIADEIMERIKPSIKIR